MLSFFKKLFNYNEREIARMQKLIDQINEFENASRNLKEDEFKKETKKLQTDIQSGEKTLDSALPWTYALVREAARRILGERHFDEQLMAGIALHEGRVAEQKTGEGKTLSATAPLYLNALTGKGAHLVTVNDYLARRDAGWMGKVFHQLGLSVSVIIADASFIYDPSYSTDAVFDWRLSHLRPVSRKEAYLADIAYGINSEFGFDYLRDNMSYGSKDMVQRGFHFAVIDEVDSVLIDEARTPHIISAPQEENTSKYYQYARIVESLDQKTDYVVDEKLHTAHLTDKGIEKIEKLLQVTNIYEKDFDTLFYVEAALKAVTLFKKDKEYIVSQGEVVIVDEFTGRLLHGRRFSEGLHQAIEAKENVAIKRESKTLATISLQNYFRMYKKLAGMTGTALTEAEEFHKIYKLAVIAIPTHKKMIREDQPDAIYKTEKGKLTALVEEVARQHTQGRPILIGTTSIEKNELISYHLKKKGIVHEMLNAKNHEREASIISRAGAKGAVTVATNMAGRGVDIILGGQMPQKIEGQTDIEHAADMHTWRTHHDEILKAGGLYVIGTERHESRRIDNQLRGRAGRQGDPGQTKFFVSLEDDLMRIFGGEQISRIMTFFKIPEDQPLEHAIVSKALGTAQVKVEGFNFDIRKHLVEFDDVLNTQRGIFYDIRNKLLMTTDDGFVFTIKETIEKALASATGRYITPEGSLIKEAVKSDFGTLFARDDLDKESVSSELELQQILVTRFHTWYEEKKQDIGKAWDEVVRSVALTTCDSYWMTHLTAIEDLREGINLRGYAQLDPLVEYKNEAYSMFERLLADIYDDLLRRLIRIELVPQKNASSSQSERPVLQFRSASAVDPFKKQALPSPVSNVSLPKRSNQTTPHKKLGRNDPCWCGSGKKYKKCHYPE